MALDTVLCSKNNPPFERMSSMAAMPDPADPGRDDVLAWPDEPDPEEEYCDYDCQRAGPNWLNAAWPASAPCVLAP
jgi:hypothetical protein